MMPWAHAHGYMLSRFTARDVCPKRPAGLTFRLQERFGIFSKVSLASAFLRGAGARWFRSAARDVGVHPAGRLGDPSLPSRPGGGAKAGFKNPSRPSLGYRRNTLGVASDSTPKCPNRSRRLRLLWTARSLLPLSRSQPAGVEVRSTHWISHNANQAPKAQQQAAEKKSGSRLQQSKVLRTQMSKP